MVKLHLLTGVPAQTEQPPAIATDVDLPAEYTGRTINYGFSPETLGDQYIVPL